MVLDKVSMHIRQQWLLSKNTIVTFANNNVSVHIKLQLGQRKEKHLHVPSSCSNDVLYVGGGD